MRAQIGEVGVIENIQLTNFMCHSRMVVSFSPNVNFVLGRNGSKFNN
jgi:recombinational DNA repair ATPase RecF